MFWVILLVIGIILVILDTALEWDLWDYMFRTLVIFFISIFDCYNFWGCFIGDE